MAIQKCYIIFCFDEIEKIQEKSRARFQSFLTSFRELIDISSLVRGHMVIAAITDAAGNTTIPLESYNEAFARRIRNKICELSVISKMEDIKKMATSINDIMQTNKSTDDIDAIAKLVYQKRLAHNNDFVITICNLLTQTANTKSWKELLNEYNLQEQFEEKKEQLIDDGIEIRIHQKFFVPISNYISMIQNSEADYTINGMQYQCVMNNVTNKCNVFLFTSDIEANINRIKNVTIKFPRAQLIVFKPSQLDLNLSVIETIAPGSDLIVYDPIEFIALLELYIDYPLNDNFKEVIDEYTKGL